ncbi:ABC transporter ATP-binding protein [Parapusillimonas granuli]|uniref:ABC transporter ATP-binding protein n=1 Tax=Parapusillimonas granuli TaxID=380911 RepID=A0A853FY35_9BURK|nr:ABC transporter ATP-binding protein [Parapusillimonas granuli]MBB5214575.1 peptide/nickel transport system ATP-binding protein [Parapusillimonas granuli]MEB2398176.1 ABC transporter ATP-binding protein [Alcaligenaceae bacterium]NYT49017.1 ABC transporter ATP-binding protein [Parapusillimonas granuli]
MNDKNILSVENLSVHFEGFDRTVVAVKDLSFHVRSGETLGIVGESGCGKSVTSLAIMRLLAKSARVVSGTIEFEGRNLLSLSEKQMRGIRGNKLSMIFQEPMTSLNPVFTVGRQIAESIVLHQGKTYKQALVDAQGLLELVQVSDPQKRLANYPYELSGGMRQRVMIAIALACKPRLLIADEPTTALDVTIQAQILQILKDIQQQLGTAIVLITHDLGVVAESCDRVMVMYAGSKVEEGRVADVLYRAHHPYTQALIRSLPAFVEGDAEQQRLAELPGIVPTITPQAVGCAFQSRCSRAVAACASAAPIALQAGDAHRYWCRAE